MAEIMSTSWFWGMTKLAQATEKEIVVRLTMLEYNEYML